ncbi:TyrA Prephenate dehydrogenase [Candidatus Nanopelagicaceae bacterium]
MTLSHVRIVGSGLIGTSIGLGLALKGVGVTMKDSDSRAQGLAEDLIKSPSDFPVDLVIFATPIGALKSVIEGEFEANPKAAFIDIGSVKSKVKVEVSTSSLPANRFLPTHPMAGREVGGAESARADLFQGRPWIVDAKGVDGDVHEKASELIELLGGHKIDLDSSEHDKAVALVSHLPQLVSSLLAKQLTGGEEQWLDLAGAGLRDTTRIAGSDSKLWREIVTANSQALTPLLQSLQSDLTKLIDSLEDENSVADLISEGQKGRARIPGKHGGKAREYTFLPIVIEDKPGQLAALFEECAQASVNVEDLTIEHSPGQFTGLITLALSESDATKLSSHLKSNGWSVHAPKM